VLGLLDSGLKDWHMFFAVANLTAIAANPNAPFKDFGQLLDALKAGRLPNVPIATAGLSLRGHNLHGVPSRPPAKIELQARHLRRRQPGVLSTVSGETQAVAQLLVEMSEFIKGKRLVPPRHPFRQARHARRLRRAGADHEVAAQHARAHELLRHLGCEGHARQRGQDHDRVWDKRIKNSEPLKKYCAAAVRCSRPISGD
jgi:hypothetical protein